MRSHCAIALCATLALASVSAARAEDELSDEERAALEAALQADAEAAPSDSVSASAAPTAQAAPTASAMNPAIALILDTALAWFSDAEPLQVGAHDPSVNGFNLQQVELWMGANVDPYFKLSANLVFAEFGVEVEEAYGQTLGLPAGLQVRAGQFLTRFGRLNPTHPHAWSFVDQPLVNGRFFGGEGSRGLGAELSWLTPLPWFVEVAGAATMPNLACCARSFVGGDDLPVEHPGDLLYTTTLKQFFPFDEDWSLSWGLSAQFGPNASGQGNRTEIYGTDLYLRWRPTDDGGSGEAVSVHLEWMVRARQVPGDSLVDHGGFAHLVWNIDKAWEIGARYGFVEALEADPLDPDEVGQRHRVQLQTTFRPSHFSRIRLQGAWDAPEWRDEPIWAGVLALELLIGAHGAHTF